MATKVEGLRDVTQEWIRGAVEFSNWHRLPWSERIVMGVCGIVRVVSSEDAVGFTIQGGNHANWLALVRGASGATVYAIPGCKVASITFDCSVTSSDYIEVP